MSTRTGVTLDDGLMIWKARDAYRVQTVVLAVFYLPQCLLALMALFYVSRGLWATAVVLLLPILALWALRWLLCRGLPRLARWSWTHLRGLRTTGRGLLVVGLLGLSGCAEYAYRANELVGINCRPEALQNGQCVTTKRVSQ
jgi:hypothetical protein